MLVDFIGDPTSGGRSFAFRFLLGESLTTTCEPLGFSTGAFVTSGAAGRLRFKAARESNIWSFSKFTLAFGTYELPTMRPTPDGVGVKGTGFAGLTISAFFRRWRCFGKGVAGGLAAPFNSGCAPFEVRVSETSEAFVMGSTDDSASGVEILRFLDAVAFFGTVAFFGIASFFMTSDSKVIVAFVRASGSCCGSSEGAEGSTSPCGVFAVFLDELFAVAFLYRYSGVSIFAGFAVRAERRSDMLMFLCVWQQSGVV